MQVNNADIVYETQSGTVHAPWKRKTTRGRVAPKRIYFGLRTYDRATGRRLSAYHPSMMSIRLVSYQIDGEQPVTFSPR